MPGSVLLIVVDKPAHRALFNRFLGNTSHHLVFATDGEDAFDRFTEVKPDLVIAHVDVPRLDGTILCQLIRQQTRGDHVPYVLLSEEFCDAEIGQSRMGVVGADGFLPFPFDRHVLIERIMALLTFGRPDPASERRSPIDRSTPEMPVPPGIGVVRRSGSTPVPSIEEASNTDLEDITHRPESSAVVEVSNLHDEAPAPDLPQRTALADAADTVVAFVNPYAAGQELEAAPAPQITDDLPEITPSKSDVQHDAKTHIELIDSRTIPFDDPKTYDPQDRPKPTSPPIQLHLDPTTPEPLPPSSGLRASPKVVIPETKTHKNTAEKRKTRELKTTEDPIDEPPILDRPPQRLEELPISETREPSGKSRLIEELPREATPSASERGAKGGVLREAVGGVRRGLDESQLGKRLVKRVRTMHRLLDQVDYYQILGVDQEATDDALKRAYFDLSLEFHPDRFFLLRSGDLKEKIYAIYRRVTEAYTVLSDERRRTAYEENVFGSSPKRGARAPTDPDIGAGSNGSEHTSSAATLPSNGLSSSSLHQAITSKFVPFEIEVASKDPKAKRLIELARASIRDGDLHSARLHLHLAKACDRENRELDAALMKVIGKEREWRRGWDPSP